MSKVSEIKNMVVSLCIEEYDIRFSNIYTGDTDNTFKEYLAVNTYTGDNLCSFLIYETQFGEIKVQCDHFDLKNDLVSDMLKDVKAAYPDITVKYSFKKFVTEEII